MDSSHVIVSLVLLAGGVVGAGIWGYRQRRKHLIERYGDAETARRMMRGIVWQGETAEQLRESLGEPEDIDEKVLKTKRKEVWKYRRTGKNRFGLRVTLDDGIVTAWDKND